MQQGRKPRARTSSRRRLWVACLTAVLTGLLLGASGSASAVHASPVIDPLGTSWLNKPVAPWTWSAHPDATIECQLWYSAPGSSTSVEGGWSACTSGAGVALAADGAYSLVVRATLTVASQDPAVAPTTETTYSEPSAWVVLDTVNPAVDVVLRAATSTSNPATPVWDVTVEDGADGTCTLTGPGAEPASTPCATGPWTTDLTGRAEGTWVLTVTARDAAGNTGTDAASYEYDIAPQAPVVTAQPSPGNDTAPAWIFVVPAGATAGCTLTGPGLPVGQEQPCSSGWAPPLSAGAPSAPLDGTYTASVVLQDAGGRSAPGTASYTYDGTAPAAPTVSGPSAPTNDPALSWTVSLPAEDVTALCTLVRDGVAGGESRCDGAGFTTALDAASGTLTVGFTAPDGRWQLSVVLVDAATNRSPAGVSPEVVVDTTPPPVPTFTSTPSSPSNGGASMSFTWNWTDQPDVIECQLRVGSTVHSGWQTCTGGTLTQSTADLPDGPVALDLRSVDSLLNRSAESTSTVVLDATAPTAPVVTGTSGTGQTPSATWSWAQEAADVATCRLRKNGTATTGWTRCTSGTAWDLDGDGTWSLLVRLTDPAGNTSLTGTSPDYLLDRVAPAAPRITGPFGTSNVRDITWTISGEDGAAVRCRVERDGQVVRDWAGCERTVAMTLDTDGSWVLLATLTDAALNTSFAGGSTAYILDTTAPDLPVVSGPTGPSSVSVVTWTWSGDTTARAECRLLRAAVAVQDWARCSTSERVVLSGDGGWVWQVRLSDSAGNTTAPASSPVYMLDTTAPAAPTVTAPRSPGSSRTPLFTIDGEPGAAVQCRVLYQSTVLHDWAECPRSLTLDLSSGGQGAYVVEARLIDTALNRSAVGTSPEYVLDTVAPAAPVVSGAAGDSSSPTPTWSWTGEQGALAHCSLLRGGTAVVDWTACASPWTPTLPSEGSWRLAVRLVDGAGNISLTGTGPEYRYDATAPLAPGVTVTPASPGRNVQPSWGFTGEAGTVASCRLTGPDGASAWIHCTSPYVTDLTGRPQGEYRLEVRLRDAAGNVSAAGSAAYVLDTVAPAAATVTAPPSPSSSPALSWSVVVHEPSLTGACRVLRDGQPVGEWAACPVSTTGTSYAYPLDGRVDGTYRLEVRLTDTAGNVSLVSGADYVFDTTAPVAVTVAAPLSPGSSRTPTWQLTAEPGSVVQCRTSLAGAYAACAGTGSFTWDLTGAPDAVYTLTVRAVDAAGNIGPSSSTTYELDTAEPAAPVVTAPRPSPGQERSPVWTWTSEAGSSAVCTLRQGTTVVSAAACAASLTVRLPSDGTYVLSVTVRDAAGNASVAGTGTYVLDTTPPDRPVIVGPSSPSSIVTPMFGFDTEQGAAVECRVSFGPSKSRLVPIEPGWQPCDEGTATIATGGVAGTYRLEVRATDVAGNTSAVGSYLFTYDADAPAGLQDLVLPTTPGNDRQPSWTWTAPDGATTACRLTGPQGLVETGPCASGFRPSAPLSVDGRYILRVVVEDAAGNVGTNDLLYVLDTVGPEAPTVTPVGAAGSQGSVPWGWSGDTTATWECQLQHNGRVVQTWQACEPGTQLLGEWGDGAYVLNVRGVDRVGNRGAVGQGSYTWKSVGPAALGVTTTSPTTGGPGPVLWTFPVPSDAVTVTCGVRRDGVFVVALTACHSSYLMNLSGLRDGLYEVVVRFADTVGNRTEQARSYALVTTVASAPRPGAVPPPFAPPPPPPPTRFSDAAGSTGRPAPAAAALLLPAGTPFGLQGPRLAAALDAGSAAPFAAAVEPGESEQGNRPGLNLAGGRLSGAGAVDALRDVATQTIKRPELPIALLLLVLLFLLVQNRIDRRDPKLAGAPLDSESDLEFGPRRGPSSPPLPRAPRAGGAPA